MDRETVKAAFARMDSPAVNSFIEHNLYALGLEKTNPDRSDQKNNWMSLWK